MAGVLKRFWVVLVVVAAILAAAAVVSRLRTFFDSDKPYIGASCRPMTSSRSTSKRVTYEIVGPPDASGQVSYLDVNGRDDRGEFHPRCRGRRR